MVIWISSNGHLMTIWLSSDDHLIIIWWSSTEHIRTYWLSFIHYLLLINHVIMWQSSNDHNWSTDNLLLIKNKQLNKHRNKQQINKQTNIFEYDDHVIIIIRSWYSYLHIVIIWWSSEYHLMIIWWSCDYYAIVIW